MNPFVLEQIKGQILPTLEQAQVVKAALFGSYVRGDNNEDSDIDILVDFPPGKSLFDFIGLQIDLEEILQKKVDLVSYKGIHPLLRDSILRWQYPILPANPEKNVTADGISQSGEPNHSPQLAMEGEKMKKDPSVFLTHILESINMIEAWLQGVTKEHFLTLQVLQEGILRRLEVIGEATKNLPAEFRDKHPEVPWRQTARMRDKISHHYFDIDFDIVWNVVTCELPSLKKQIEELLKNG